MKLMTKQIEKRFAKIGDQSETNNPIIVAKFFNPCGSGTWYATSYDPETRIFFGYVTGLAYDEWGTFSLDEMEALVIKPFGLGIERDIHFDEILFKELFPDE